MIIKDGLERYILTGELCLDGSIYPVRGALCIACQAQKDKVSGIILPSDNPTEARLVAGLDVFGVKHLSEVLRIFSRTAGSPSPSIDLHLPLTSENQIEARDTHRPVENNGPDFKDVRGQGQIKRALEIAAAGGHNTLLICSPGVGKTMLAKRLPSILPRCPPRRFSRLPVSKTWPACNSAAGNYPTFPGGPPYRQRRRTYRRR